MAELLSVQGLKSGYGEAVVVQGIDLALEKGRSIALLGRNGTGKTTFLNTLVGATRHHAGRIVLDGRDITTLPSHKRAAAGIGWVPQERNIFKSLTVEENLSAVHGPGRGRWRVPTRCSRAWPNARPTWATSCPAASSRCSRSRVRWC